MEKVGTPLTMLSSGAEFDVTGGLDPEVDFMLPAPPRDADTRDSCSMWISDETGLIGLPRMCIETMGSDWDNRGVQANIAFPDGRVLVGHGGFAPAPPKIINGKTVTLNAGPLTFEVKEPLRRWLMTFDGLARETTVLRQMRGEQEGAPKHVRIDIDATMAAPPWVNGEKATKIGDLATAKAVGAVGGHRHEQLFRCNGCVAIEGERQITFAGTGLRIRRYGARDTGQALGLFPGHVWQSAVFPSGRAFGVLAFPPRRDGTPAYSEAFLFDDGRMIYGVVLEAAWMKTLIPHGGAVDAVIETEAGERVRIGGRTHDTTFVPRGGSMWGDWAIHGKREIRTLPIHQGGALYSWDGEQAYGMIERSLPDYED